MKTIFLSGLIAGYEVMEWANRNKVKIIRCQFKNVREKEGAIVSYIDSWGK